MSLRKISKIHSVAYSTLFTLVRTGKSFHGSGTVEGSKYLSLQEEKLLADKARGLISSGFEFTWADLNGLIQQDVEFLFSKDPQRTKPPSNWPNNGFTRRFAVRHNLKDFIKPVWLAQAKIADSVVLLEDL